MKTKTVTVRHTLAGAPDELRVAKQIDWWTSRGFRLVRREERQPSLFAVRLRGQVGQTELTFTHSADGPVPGPTPGRAPPPPSDESGEAH